MSRFIKLTNIIVNTNKIISIKTSKEKHSIFMTNHKLDGYVLLPFGFFDTTDNCIEINRNNNPIDYEIIAKLINKINTVYES